MMFLLALIPLSEKERIKIQFQSSIEFLIKLFVADEVVTKSDDTRM